MIVIARGTSATLLVVLAVGLAACGSSTKKTSPATSTTTSTAPATTTRSSATTSTTSTSPATISVGTATGWTRPALGSDGSIPVAAFNALLNGNQSSWTHSPLRISVEFLQLDDTAARTTTAGVSTNPDSLQQADVVITANGLLDDSIRATRFDLHLARQTDKSWRITSARWSQQCQPNRGHQDFTPQLCV